MRVRLFWKILFSFWLTFICIVEGVWIIFSLNDAPHQRPWETALERSVADVRLGSAETALRLGGEAGLRSLLASWPEAERGRLSFEQITTGEAPSPRNGPGAGGRARLFPHCLFARRFAHAA